MHLHFNEATATHCSDQQTMHSCSPPTVRQQNLYQMIAKGIFRSKMEAYEFELS